MTVVSTPSEHATGDKSPPCTCKGRKGEAISDGLIAIVRFDSGGRAGIPWANLRKEVVK